jgi:hypothetical protein
MVGMQSPDGKALGVYEFLLGSGDVLQATFPCEVFVPD